MSALEWPAAAPASKADQDWAAITVAAPQLALTMGRYLDPIATVLAATSVEVADNTLRQLARFLLEATDVRAVADVRYGHTPQLPADYESATMAKLRREAHARMLGNGLCTRPVELDCRMESACETCSYFHTSSEFQLVLIRQRDHARAHGQTDRAALFERLIDRVERDNA